MANLGVEESRKLMSPDSDLSFDELESNRPGKPSSARSSGSDYAFPSMSRNNSPKRFLNFKLPNGRQLRLIVSVTAALVVAVFVYLLWTPSHRRPIVWNPSNPTSVGFPGEDDKITPPSNESTTAQKWIKPTGFKIVGFVFCE